MLFELTELTILCSILAHCLCCRINDIPENLKSNGPFYKHGLTWIPSWISNHTPSKVWDEITYPFLNFNGATVEVLQFLPTLYNGCNYLSMLGLKLIHVSKRRYSYRGYPGNFTQFSANWLKLEVAGNEGFALTNQYVILLDIVYTLRVIFWIKQWPHWNHYECEHKQSSMFVYVICSL